MIMRSSLRITIIIATAMMMSVVVVSGWTTTTTTTRTRPSSSTTTTATSFFSSRTPSSKHRRHEQQNRRRQPLLLFMSDQWTDEEETTESSEETSNNNNNNNNNRRVTSFDEAGKGLLDEEDQKRLDEMGDFDENPDYSSDNIDKMREAIRKRTAAMGLEKKSQLLSRDAVKEASRRASEGGSSSLDLTKIRGQLDPNVPSMFYDPEEEMTDEEKKQVDPIDTKNLLEQARNEISNSKWPDWGSALREVGIMFVVVAASAFLIIEWDQLLRNFYTDRLHLIPTTEEIQSRFTGLDLPEGWTNSLNENDVANLPSRVRDTMTTMDEK